MSAIGNYIHLNFKNYQQYGTAQYGESPQYFINSYNAQKAKNQQQIQVLKNRDISQATLEELKRRVANESNQNEARQLAQLQLNYSQAENDFSTNTKAKILSEVGKNIGKVTYLTNKNIISDNSLVKIEEAIKYRNRLYDNIDSLNKDMENPNHKFKDLEGRIQTIINNFDGFFNSLGISTIYGNLSSLFKIKADSNTLTALKAFVQTISLNEANKATFNGVYGETLVNMADDVAQNLGQKELINYTKEALKTGAITSTFQIDETMISKEVQQIFQQDTGINLYQIRSSQNKVDASITIKNQKVEASVKAYTPKGNILTPHLQDVSLISSLVTTENQFGNHWLNLHMQSAKNMSSNTSDADEILKQHIAYEALAAGNLLKTDATIADTFVAIDVVKGRVYVQRISDILSNDFSSFIFKPVLQSLTFENNRADTWEQRISNILQQIHQNKISVSYRVNMKEI
jgi:hypothetical protein